MDFCGIKIKIILFTLFCAGGLPLAHASSQAFVNSQFDKQNYEEVIAYYQETPFENAQQKSQLALSYFYSQDYSAALPLMQGLVDQGDSSAEVSLALVEILISKSEFQNALSHLDAGHYEAPDEKIRAGLLKARAKRHTGDLGEAQQILDGLGPTDAYYQQKLSLELASVLTQKGDTDTAKSVMQNALALDAESFTAGKLRYRLKHLESRRTLKRLDAQLSFRTEYDSNVNLNPDDYLVTNYNRQSDIRTSFVADVFHQATVSRDWNVSSELHLYQNQYQDLNEFNETAFNLSLSPAFHNKEFILRLPFEVEQSLKEGEVYSRRFAFSPGVSVHNQQNIWTHLYAKLSNINYELDVESYENPDAVYVGGGALVLIPIAHYRSNLRFLIETGKHQASGSNWDRNESIVLLTLNTRLISKLYADFSYQFQYAQFDGKHQTYIVNRLDESHWFSLKLSWAFMMQWDVFAQLAYVDQASEIPLYDYSREAAALGISWRY